MNRSVPVINMVATGWNIVKLRTERGLTVKDMQRWFGLEEPRAIYKWQHGETLPSVDNLLALSALFEVSMDDILIVSNTDSAQLPDQDEWPVFFTEKTVA